MDDPSEDLEVAAVRLREGALVAVNVCVSVCQWWVTVGVATEFLPDDIWCAYVCGGTCLQGSSATEELDNDGRRLSSTWMPVSGWVWWSRAEVDKDEPWEVNIDAAEYLLLLCLLLTEEKEAMEDLFDQDFQLLNGDLDDCSLPPS